MTPLGKILVFFNLIFSVIVGALVLFDYAARTHWAEGVKKRDDLINILNASNKALQTAKQKVVNEANDKVAAAASEVTAVKNTLGEREKEIAKLREDYQTLLLQADKHMAVATGAQEEVKLRQQDVLNLRNTIAKLDQKNTELVKEANEANQNATAARIEKDAALDRNKQLLEQLQMLAKQLETIRARGGPTPTRVASRGKNPPPETVEGLVLSVSGDGLMTLSIGSDSGVRKGHTLEVFRLDPPKYLGTVRVIESGPKEAVAQPEGRLLGEVRVRDSVASRIMGN
jgi:hypothetical protein